MNAGEEVVLGPDAVVAGLVVETGVTSAVALVTGEVFVLGPDVVAAGVVVGTGVTTAVAL